MTQTRMLAEQPTAVRRAILVPDQLAEWVPRACAEVAGHLFHRDITPSGYPYARYHRLFDDLIGVEAGFPVPPRITSTHRIEPSTLPAGPVLVAWYTGPDEKVGLAYQQLDEWLQSLCADRNGDGWEIYHDLPTVDHDRRHLEVVQPISLRTPPGGTFGPPHGSGPELDWRWRSTNWEVIPCQRNCLSWSGSTDPVTV